MPQGAAPGERRGGRQKGTPNRATAAKRDGIAEALNVALARIGPGAIDHMSPAQYLRFCFREAAKAGYAQAAAALAKDAAPYFDPRMTVSEGSSDPEVTIRITGGLPDVR